MTFLPYFQVTLPLSKLLFSRFSAITAKIDELKTTVNILKLNRNVLF